MRFNELTSEGIDPGAKAAIKGMRELSSDQYYGLYKTMKDVAGHDGEKQTAPEGATDHEVSDKPFAYAYTDEEKNMIKGVDPKAKQITSDKSEELDEGMEEAYEPVYSPHGTNRSGIFSPNRGIARRSLTAVNKFLEKPFNSHQKRTDFLLSLVPDRKLKELVGVLAYEHFPFDDLRELPWFMKRLNLLIARAEQRLNQDVAEAGNNYHANRTGFAKPQGHRDDERHDLDVARPLIYGLKINGKIWQKDGNTVTFFTKERALAARNSILTKRPDVEVGLVQRPQD